MNDLSGQQWGTYRLLRLLGQGGFASVYLGEHMRLKTRVAVKILHTFLSQEGSESFLHEAQTVASFIHPHIVRVFDFDVQENHPFLVMDYAPHGSLSQLHPIGTRVPLAQVVSYVKPIASALQYAHDQRLIHRDVKPQNMLVNHHNEVLLSDFGIVAMAHSTSSMDTGSVVGTLLYMAPEQIQGKPRPASDQYGLAVTAYSWLTGTLPFKGSTTEVVAQHLSVAPPPLRAVAPDLPTEVEQVILTALAKDPKDRFANVAAFAHALEQAASGQTTVLRQQPPPMSTTIQNTPAQGVPVAAIASPQLAATPPQGAMQERKAEPETPRTSDVIDINSQSSDGFSRRKLLIAGGIGLGALGLGAMFIPGLLRSGPFGPHIYTYTLPFDLFNYLDFLWSPDNTRLALFFYDAIDGEEDKWGIHIWDALDGGHATTFTLDKKIGNRDFVWSGNKLLMVWYSKNIDDPNTIFITDVTGKKEVLSYFGHIERTDIFYNVAWSPDAHKVASAGSPFILNRRTPTAERIVIYIWDAATGKDLVTCKVKPAEEPGYEYLKDDYFQELFADHLTPYYLLWSPDGIHILSWRDNALFAVWNVNGSLVSRYTGHWEARKEEHKQDLAKEGYISSTQAKASWSPDGTRILSLVDGHHGNYQKDQDNTRFHLWDAATGKQIGTYSNASSYFNASSKQFLWSPDSQFFAFHHDDAFTVWSAIDGRELYRSPNTNYVEWIPGTSSLAFLQDVGKELWTWDATTNQATRIYSESELSMSSLYGMESAMWSPDGKYIAVYVDEYGSKKNKIHIWKAPQ